jgi:hypothetical protein
MNKVASVILFGMVVCNCIPVTGWSQSRTVVPGDTIRVTYTYIVTSRAVGELKRISDDSLLLAHKDSTWSFARSSINRIDVSTGSRTWGGRGAAIGAVTGGLLFGVIMMASDGSGDSGSDSWDFFDEGDGLFTSGQSFLIGFGVGAAGGAFAGLIIGGLTETHRWEKVPLELGVEPISFRLAKSPNNYGFTLRWSF